MGRPLSPVAAAVVLALTLGLTPASVAAGVWNALGSSYSVRPERAAAGCAVEGPRPRGLRLGAARRLRPNGLSGRSEGDPDPVRRPSRVTFMIDSTGSEPRPRQERELARTIGTSHGPSEVRRADLATSHG